MRFLLLFIICFELFCSCKQNNDASAFINPSNLPAQTFTINTQKDTVVQTTGGMKIKISANALIAAAAQVTMQVKEAHSIEEIANAGLITKSSQGALSSDGMFYIGFAEAVTIQKAIQVSFPTQYVNKQMKLFKGEENDGAIEWKDPVPVKAFETPVSDAGKALFMSNCASCHRIEDRLVGPALAWIDKRRDKEWIYRTIHNPAQFMKYDEALACLFAEHHGMLMQAFPGLSKATIDTLLQYIDAASKQMNIPETFNPDKALDSCIYTAGQYKRLMQIKDSILQRSVEYGYIPDTPDSIPDDSSRIIDTQIVQNKIIPTSFEAAADYYQLDITATGWFNIDMMLHNCDNVEESKLIVRVQGTYQQKLRVYLALPSVKVFLEGGLLDDKQSYGFDDKDGNMPLPQNATAIVFAVSEQDKKFYYAQTKFTTSASQTISLNLQASSEAAIHASLAKIDIGNTSIAATKDFNNLEALNHAIDSIAPLAKQCNCYPDTSRLRGTDTFRLR